MKEKDCEAVLDEFSEELMAMANVVGLGIVERDHDHELVLGVYVSKKEPKNRLRQEDVVPRILRMGKGAKALDVATQVIEMGVPGLE